MNKYLPDEQVRETIRDLAVSRRNLLWEPELIAMADVKDELNELGFVFIWLDELPPADGSPTREEYDLMGIIEIGKRMRALQQEYFKSRRKDILSNCIKLEKDFDTLLENAERYLRRNEF